MQLNTMRGDNCLVKFDIIISVAQQVVRIILYSKLPCGCDIYRIQYHITPIQCNFNLIISQCISLTICSNLPQHGVNNICLCWPYWLFHHIYSQQYHPKWWLMCCLTLFIGHLFLGYQFTLGTHVSGSACGIADDDTQGKPDESLFGSIENCYILCASNISLRMHGCTELLLS